MIKVFILIIVILLQPVSALGKYEIKYTSNHDIEMYNKSDNNAYVLTAHVLRTCCFPRVRNISAQSFPRVRNISAQRLYHTHLFRNQLVAIYVQWCNHSRYRNPAPCINEAMALTKNI